MWLVLVASRWTTLLRGLRHSDRGTEGQILTIDGSTGEVMVGKVPTVLWRSKRIDRIEQTWCTQAAGTTISNQIQPDDNQIKHVKQLNMLKLKVDSFLPAC